MGERAFVSLRNGTKGQQPSPFTRNNFWPSDCDNNEYNHRVMNGTIEVEFKNRQTALAKFSRHDFSIRRRRCISIVCSVLVRLHGWQTLRPIHEIMREYYGTHERPMPLNSTTGRRACLCIMQLTNIYMRRQPVATRTDTDIRSSSRIKHIVMMSVRRGDSILR